MSAAATYPRRLIEVDLPIGTISEQAREGRSVHHGHITAIHIWWARKPLASCRAVTLAAALLDPADPLCPAQYLGHVAETLSQLYTPQDDHYTVKNPDGLRRGLLRLVEDFSSWQQSREPRYLTAAQALVQAAHEAAYGEPGGTPFLADPFAGGGSIPLEGLRLGCSVYTSDLNPVATLISKVTLEYLQRHGEPLLEAVERWGAWISDRAVEELARYYPTPDKVIPLAYLWFRRIRCEAPGCGADVPLTSKFQLWRNGAHSVGLRVQDWDQQTPRFEIAEGPLGSFPEPTIRRGAATCLRCGYTMAVERVRAQLTEREGGASTAQLVAVATAGGEQRFRPPSHADLEAARAASTELERRIRAADGDLPLVPDEPLPAPKTLGFRVQRYGMLRWKDLFTPRQLLVVTTLGRLVREVMPEDRQPGGLGAAVRSCLALAIDRVCDYMNTGCSWNPSSASLPHLFTRQALPIIWDFGEANPLGGSSGDWRSAVEHVSRGLRNALISSRVADVGCASAHSHPLPTDCAHLLITDPPYYDAIPYADLSDFFYVWLRRVLRDDHPDLLGTPLVPKEHECVVNPAGGKSPEHYRRIMTEALAEARRITRPDGIGVVIFAHKSTKGWEDLLAAMLEAGWVITASWPIDTENASRLRAQNSAVLASSVHLVCRPRERPDGSLITDTVGDWRDVLDELRRRIHEWMPRLEKEGISGADAIFSCLGPALEVFSRYARVEKGSGEQMKLEHFLEQVWSTVSSEALGMIFRDVDTTGFEVDARLTAMWLWTMARGTSPASAPEQHSLDEEEPATGDSDDEPPARGKVSGFALEFDAARKIAQGLGAHLEDMTTLVEARAGIARLLPVAERARVLLTAAKTGAAQKKTRKKAEQLDLDFVAAVDTAEKEGAWGKVGMPAPGATVLDRLHQAMLLFAANKADTLRRFLVEGGVAEDPKFWRLAQALSALYPSGTNEKRWVDGLLARRKGVA